MINQSSILLSEGGLFDFGATLPLLAIQFLVLMTILNLILYSPLLKAIDDRTSYVVSNLSKSAELLEKADSQLATYESDLKTRRKAAQAELVQIQKECKEIVATDLGSIDQLINSSVNDVTKKILNRTSELFKLMFSNETSSTPESSALSSQLFYSIYFPSYLQPKANLVAIPGLNEKLFTAVVRANSAGYKARSSKKKITVKNSYLTV